MTWLHYLAEALLAGIAVTAVYSARRSQAREGEVRAAVEGARAEAQRILGNRLQTWDRFHEGRADAAYLILEKLWRVEWDGEGN